MSSILVVEDDPDVANLITDILDIGGYDVKKAMSGTEALQCLDQPLDCMILDLMLPGMSGLEVLEVLHTNEKEQLPVIVLTALSDAATEWSSVAAGADFFMTKPFSTSRLLDLVEVLVSRK